MKRKTKGKAVVKGDVPASVVRRAGKGKGGQDANISELIRQLRSEDPEVRDSSFRKPAEKAEKSKDISNAVPAVIDFLNDEEHEVQENAARTLWKIGIDKIPELKDRVLVLLILNKTDEVAAMGETAVPYLINVFRDWFCGRPVDNAYGTLVEIGEPAIPYLIEALKDEDPDLWGYSFSALEEIAEAEVDCSSAVPVLIEALEDKGYRSYCAASTLDKINKNGGIPEHMKEEVKAALKKALEDPDSAVSENAARVLKEIE